MITDQDVTTLKQVFATKEEYQAFERKFDGVIEIVGDLKVELGETKDNTDLILERLDRYIGEMKVMKQENAFGAGILGCHGRQLDALAHEVGIILPD